MENVQQGPYFSRYTNENLSEKYGHRLYLGRVVMEELQLNIVDIKKEDNYQFGSKRRENPV